MYGQQGALRGNGLREYRGDEGRRRLRGGAVRGQRGDAGDPLRAAGGGVVMRCPNPECRNPNDGKWSPARRLWLQDGGRWIKRRVTTHSTCGAIVSPERVTMTAT